MQMQEHMRTFTLAGQTYSYQLTPRRALGLGTVYDVTISNAAGSIVANRAECYLLKDTPIEHGLQPLLQSMMDERPTLPALRTEATRHTPRTDMGPTRPGLWS